MDKLCPTCGLVKAGECFANAKGTKDGLNWQCRDCHQVRMAKQRKKYRKEAKDNRSGFVLRRCSKCGVEKPTMHFNLNASQPNGISHYCKDCENLAKAERSKRRVVYHNENPIFYTEGDTKTCCHCKKCLLVSSFYRDKARPDGLCPDCKECHAEAGRQSKVRNPEWYVLKSVRDRAKVAGIEFSITEDDVFPMPEYCPVLGIKMDRSNIFKKRDHSPAVDRIDNTKGYIPGNVMVVSYKANRMKSNASLGELSKFGEFYSKLFQTYI